MTRPAVILALLLVTVACDRGQQDAPGSLLAGETAAFSKVLSSCTELSQTPAAHWCTAVLENLEECTHFLAECQEGEDCTIGSSLRCTQPGKLDELGLAEGSSWLFRHTSVEGWSFEVRGVEQEDLASTRLAVSVENVDHAAWGRWLPGVDNPGDDLLSGDGAIAQLRLRPAGGLNIASSLGKQSLADRLFSLRSDLFTAAVLKGNLELAVYLPDGGQLIPPMALALDFALRQPAVLAMESFIEDIRVRYPVSRVDFAIGGNAGACLANLRVMPDLAPCYVATDKALIVGWNATSVELALAGGSSTGPGTASRLRLHLDRFPAADGLLAAAHGRQIAGFSRYPWSSAQIEGRRTGRSVGFDVVLENWSGE